MTVTWCGSSPDHVSQPTSSKKPSKSQAIKEQSFLSPLIVVHILEMTYYASEMARSDMM